MDSSKSCFEIWMDKKPGLRHTRVFGSDAFMHIPKQFTKKFDARSKKVMFVGYQLNSCNYRLYDSSSKRIVVSRNVTFNETCESLVGNDSVIDEGINFPCDQIPDADPDVLLDTDAELGVEQAEVQLQVEADGDVEFHSAPGSPQRDMSASPPGSPPGSPQHGMPASPQHDAPVLPDIPAPLVPAARDRLRSIKN